MKIDNLKIDNKSLEDLNTNPSQNTGPFNDEIENFETLKNNFDDVFNAIIIGEKNVDLNTVKLEYIDENDIIEKVNIGNAKEIVEDATVNDGFLTSNIVKKLKVKIIC